MEALDGARAAAAWDVDGGGVAAVGIGSSVDEVNGSPRPASVTASLMGSVRRGGGEGRRSGSRFRGAVERQKEVIFK